MAVHNLGENIKTGLALEPIGDDGAQNGVVIDRKGFYGAVFTTVVGLATGSPSAQTVDSKIQESDANDGSGMTDVSGATMTQIAADSLGGEINVDLNSLKRYIRVVTTVALTGGTTPKLPVGVTYTLGLPNVGGV